MLNSQLARKLTKTTMADFDTIRKALKESEFDAWLFYDHHHRDPVAYRVLGLAPSFCTRRWYYLIPASGEPEKLSHAIERSVLAALPGRERVYASWREQHKELRAMLSGRKRIAMQYSPLNNIPYIGLVDAGTVELVRSLGAEIVSSADLVQLFEARWSQEALAMHLEAGERVHLIVHRAFNLIADGVKRDKPLNEYGLQQQILELFEREGLETEDPPVVAANRNTANPHYSPTPQKSLPLAEDALVLLDIWARRRLPGAVYFDVTWTGYVGDKPPRPYAEVFDAVREARDAGIELVRSRLRSGQPLRGCDVDDEVRGILARRGYAKFFVHRTGHSIGREIHGNGANLDNFETRDERAILPFTCFSIEPGVYLSDFGVRSEVNVYAEEHGARVTGEVQQSIVPILAASL